MKKVPISILILIAFYCQCTNKITQPFATNACPSLFFNVPAHKDTVIVTSKGMKISIPSGALQSGSAPYARIEVKEAYTITDMLEGRLTTRSGDNILSSGGMFYINAADNNTTIVKPITISIPTPYQQKGMQLYKGEPMADGKINWTDPQPLPAQSLDSNLLLGKELYTANCQSCHSLTKLSSGPPLAYLDKNRDWQWLRKFVANSAKMIGEDRDWKANCVYNCYKTAMTAFPDISDSELHAIFDYANYEADNTDPNFKKLVDSCELYNKLNRSRIREAVDTTFSTTIPNNLVNNIKNRSLYYEFKIQTLGWFNIDILLKNLPGFENSQLTVSVSKQFKNDISIYLVIPSKKILLDGGLLKNESNVYCFFTTDGHIPLPQNTEAYVMAIAEKNGQLFYGSTAFTTSLNQSLEIKPTTTTKDQMTKNMKQLIPDHSADVLSMPTQIINSADTLLTQIINYSQSDIEKLRPTECECDCVPSERSDYYIKPSN